MSDTSHVFDGSFNWLSDLPYRERGPAILAALTPYRVSPIPTAIAFHYAELEDLPGQAFPDIKDKTERSKQYFEQYLPEVLSLDRRRLSELRTVAKTVIDYSSDLSKAGVNLFDADIIEKLLSLPKAIKRYGRVEQVFLNFAYMTSRAFANYADGKISGCLHTTNQFKEYIDECNRIESLLSF